MNNINFQQVCLALKNIDPSHLSQEVAKRNWRMKEILQKFSKKSCKWISSHPSITGKILSLISPIQCDESYLQAFIRKVKEACSQESKAFARMLRECIRAKNESMGLKLLEGSVTWDVDVPSSTGKTPLACALSKGMDRLAYRLIEEGASLDEVEQSCFKPSHFNEGGVLHRLVLRALDKGNLGLTQDLLQLEVQIGSRNYRLSPNLRGKQEKTLLHLARMKGWDDLMLELLKRGAEVNPVDTFGQGVWTDEDVKSDGIVYQFFLSCLETGDEETAIRLLSAVGETQAFDLNAVDSDGASLLHLACMNQCVKVILNLIHRGVNPKVTDNYNLSPADYAFIYFPTPDVCQLLVQKQQSASELLERSWLAHVWNLQGYENFGEIEFDYQGFYTSVSCHRISSSVQQFLKSEEMKELIQKSPEIKQMHFQKLARSLEKMPINHYRKSEEILQDLNQAEPQALYYEWEEHSVAIVFGRQDRVMKCNQGEETSEKDAGVQVFTMNDYSQLQQVIEELQEKKEKDLYLSRIDDLLQLNRKRILSQKSQDIGNCSYASLQSAILGLFYDQALEDFPGQEDLAFQCAILLYKTWVQYARFNELVIYLKQTKDFGIELLDMIADKTEELESRKEAWKGKTDQVVALLQKYIPNYQR